MQVGPVLSFEIINTSTVLLFSVLFVLVSVDGVGADRHKSFCFETTR